MVAVVGAPAAPSAPSPSIADAAIADAVARALAVTGGRLGDVVLADATVDGAHRARHGLRDDPPGLAELARLACAGRLCPEAIRAASHLTEGGYRLVPGADRSRGRHPFGAASVPAVLDALDALRADSSIAVLAIGRGPEPGWGPDADTAGHAAFTRVIMGRCDLVLIACPPGPPLGAVDGLGLRAEQVGIVPSGPCAPPPVSPRCDAERVLRIQIGVRADQRFGVALRTLLPRPWSRPPASRPAPDTGTRPR